MRIGRLLGASWLAFAVMWAGCAPRQEPGGRSGEAPRATAPKRLTVAITGDPTVLNFALLAGGNRGGVQELETLVNAGLAIVDDQGALRPLLAEAVPTTENDQWKLFPNGRMETTWRIKQGATWHDGTPFTSEDLAFTAIVGQDRDLPFVRNPAYRAIESVDAPDARTVTVKWKQPFIDADGLFTRAVELPIPKHLLESTYLTAKDKLAEVPYWSEEYVGTGPFRLREYVRSSHLVLEANDRYVLGRPKIDQIEVRSILDSNVLIASVLAGEVELTLGWGLSIQQAVEVGNQWRDGKAEHALTTFILIHPQFVNPSPPVVANRQFLQALLHATDREQMAESIQHGMVPVAHSFLPPTHPAYKDVQDSVARYEHDPRRAAQLVEELGYRRGGDGIFRDAANAPLSVELRSGGSALEITQKSVLSVADYWQRVGVGADSVFVPVQRSRDREYAANRPGYELTRTSANLRLVGRLNAAVLATAENNYRGEANNRYQSPGLGALIDRYLQSVPREERIQALRQILHHVTDRVVHLPLFYDSEPVLLSNRLHQVSIISDERTNSAWNAHEWEKR